MDKILDDILIKDKDVYTYKLSPTIFWGSIFALGILFKTLHWSGFSLLGMIGASGTMAHNLSALIRLRGNHTINNILCTLSAIWIVYVVIGLIFYNGHPLNLIGLFIHIGLLIFIFFTYEIIERVNKRANKIYKL